MEKNEKKQRDKIKKEKQSDNPFMLPPKLVGVLADEVAKTLITRLPNMIVRPRKKPAQKKSKKIEYPIFLDTSAIIDRRIFDIIELGLLTGTIVILDSILGELKRIADSQDMVRRERGRRGLEDLEKLKKSKRLKVHVIALEEEKQLVKEIGEVDERLIRIAKSYKGKIITCDYNLEKKAAIQNIIAINVNALANCLKILAVPGEALHIKLQHKGKDITQGVGYLDDGTMIVVEHGSDGIGKDMDVVVSRVIQTATGRILFAKKI